MTATGLPGAELRERWHLDPFVKDEFEARTGRRPVSRTLKSEAFPGLGAVDVLAEHPKLLMELKWSYAGPGKVFESVWDAIKLSILGPAFGFDHLYIAAGAAGEVWGLTESANLFETGTIDPLEMWDRELEPRRGPNYGASVGEDLVIGSRGNQPIEGPREIELRRLESFPVAGDYELRLVSIGGNSRLRTWPQIDVP